jgi:hypothetical protein
VLIDLNGIHILIYDPLYRVFSRRWIFSMIRIFGIQTAAAMPTSSDHIFNCVVAVSDENNRH